MLTQQSPASPPDLLDLDLRLDTASNLLVMAGGDLEQVIECDGDLPIFAAIDLTLAARHLRQALRLVDRAADRLARGGVR